MRKLIITILSVLLIQSQAMADCQEALKNADGVIVKQDELIQLQTDRITELRDENQRLTDAMVELKSLADEGSKEQWMFGLSGVALGIVAGILLTK
jgi:hypothetical protein